MMQDRPTFSGVRPTAVSLLHGRKLHMAHEHRHTSEIPADIEVKALVAAQIHSGILLDSTNTF